MQFQISNFNMRNLTLLILLFLQVTGCTMHTASQSLSNDIESEEQSSKSSLPDYKIVGKICTNDNIYYLMIYTDSKHFNKTDLLMLIKVVSEKYENAEGLTVNLFDDLDLAEAYGSGKREQLNLFSEIRGRYIRGGSEEFLIFSPDERKLNNSKKIVRIDLKNK